MFDSPVQNNQRVLTGTECMHLELTAPYCSSCFKACTTKGQDAAQSPQSETANNKGVSGTPAE